MNLIIKQNNQTVERVPSELIDLLYNLAKADASNGGASIATIPNDGLQGRIEATVAYQDAVDYLNEHFEPNLIVSAMAYYIRFADPEVESVIKTALGKGQDEGVLASELSSFRPIFNGNTVIEYFDEMKYCSPNVMEYAFKNCTNLKSIDLTNITRMSGNGNYFNGCINLEYFHGIDGERGVLNLLNLTNASFTYWFADCKKLERITSLGFISTIGNWAFSGCSALESVIGISSVTAIYSNAFENCSSLSIITLQNITRIDDAAFSACSSLEYCDGPNSTQGELNLPNLTGTLGYSAFKGCVKLTSIASLGNIVSIGSSAFENCTNLATINFPSTITSVGINAFNNTAWYNSQPNGEVIIGSCLYKYKGTLTGSYSVPNNITYITAGAYADKGITSLTIPDTVTYIGNEAFVRCPNLASVNLGNGVETLDGNVFVNCTSLTSVTLPDSLVKLNGQTFRGCTALETLVIGSGLKSISGYQFTGCSALSSVTVSSNSTTFDSRNNCNAVIKSSTNELVLGCKTTIIPNTVTKLGERAFNDVTNLTSIVIPNSVTSIGKYCFAGCSNMTTVTISNNVTSIVEGAFNGCTRLTSVDIPNSVTSIDSSSFTGCSGLTSVTIPSSVVSIGSNAFRYCSALTSVTIPDGIVSIGGTAFSGCNNVTEITIGSTITSIGSYAFEIRNLLSLTIYAVTPPTVGSSIFGTLNTTAKIYVPAGSVEAYKTADGWKNIPDINNRVLAIQT